MGPNPALTYAVMYNQTHVEDSVTTAVGMLYIVFSLVGKQGLLGLVSLAFILCSHQKFQWHKKA